MSLKAMIYHVKIKVVGGCAVSLSALYHIFGSLTLYSGGCIDHVVGCHRFLEALH